MIGAPGTIAIQGPVAGTSLITIDAASGQQMVPAIGDGGMLPKRGSRIKVDDTEADMAMLANKKKLKCQYCDKVSCSSHGNLFTLHLIC